MQCPQCGLEAREGAKFCRKCGTRFELACPACGAQVAPDDSFCEECGTALPTSSSSTPAQAPPVAPPATLNPRSYTPQHLAERIISSRSALEGERKQVTVLFADLKGSMELFADRDPEEARRILDPVLERMMEAVHRYEGTVNQVMGDGIMALFGAPLAHEDHALRACYAALRMQDAVKAYAQEVQRNHGVPLQMRVGLNSGEVVVRAIGSDLRMDYSAIGQTTHLAARMEQSAMPGSVLLAPDTLRLVEGYVRITALGPMRLKGLDEPVAVYELIGAGTARSRLQAAAVRGLTKFVGRDTELDTLRRTLELATNGHGQIVALVGEPGVGKSRLVWEFGHSHRTQGWLLLEAGSVSYGKATSYLPMIDLLKTYCGIEERDDTQRMHEKLTGKLLTLDPALGPTLPALLSLLDVPVADPRWQALDPPQRRQGTLDACKRLLLRESQRQPLLLVFEDLHWIDSETQALLDSLADSLPTAHLLLLVNYRPEYEHTWHRQTYYQQLRLDPLPPESADALLAALLGDAAELQPLKRALIERTEGNPFFVEESVRTLVEAGVLGGEIGGYRLARPFESTQVPATVQAVLAARIDRLAPEDKRLLQAAAVVGKDVPYALLQAIAELPEDALGQGLVRLQTAEFLYETSLFPDLEYTFKHALTHEVAYGSLLHERRCTLHAAIVRALETRYADRPAEQIERLAHHALRGELWEPAVGYLRDAARKAVEHFAHAEALTYLEQALTALDHLPKTRASSEQRLDLYVAIHQVTVPLGQHQNVAQLEQAEALAVELHDQPRLGEVLVALCNCLSQVGEYDRAVAAGRRGLAIAEALGNRTAQRRAYYYLGQAYYGLGDYRRASALAQDAMTIADDGALERPVYGAGLPAVTSRAWLAIFLAEQGEFGAAIDRAEEALHIADSAAHPFTLAVAFDALGRVHLARGSLAEAIAMQERSLDLCRARDIRRLLPAVATVLGAAYAHSGRIEEAGTLLEEATTADLAVGGFRGRTLPLVWTGEAHLAAGRRVDASRSVALALDLSRNHQQRGHEAWALRLLGDIAAHADALDIDQAEGHYRQALALAEELGMHPLAAHCHLGLGTLYQQIGRDAEAQVELTTAAELYRAMEMPFWLAKAEATLAQVAR